MAVYSNWSGSSSIKSIFRFQEFVVADDFLHAHAAEAGSGVGGKGGLGGAVGAGEGSGEEVVGCGVGGVGLRPEGVGADA